MRSQFTPEKRAPLARASRAHLSRARASTDTGGQTLIHDALRATLSSTHARRCDSSYDTYVHVYDLDGNERYECDDCGAYSCPNHNDDDDDSCCWTVATFELEAGDFVLLIEGYSCDRGAYTFTVACADEVHSDDEDADEDDLGGECDDYSA